MGCDPGENVPRPARSAPRRGGVLTEPRKLPIGAITRDDPMWHQGKGQAATAPAPSSVMPAEPAVKKPYVPRSKIKPRETLTYYPGQRIPKAQKARQPRSAVLAIAAISNLQQAVIEQRRLRKEADRIFDDALVEARGVGVTFADIGAATFLDHRRLINLIADHELMGRIDARRAEIKAAYARKGAAWRRPGAVQPVPLRLETPVVVDALVVDTVNDLRVASLDRWDIASGG
jgi:hypothetical protein